jgi:hypothetical protein
MSEVGCDVAATSSDDISGGGKGEAGGSRGDGNSINELKNPSFQEMSPTLYQRLCFSELRVIRAAMLCGVKRLKGT